MRSILVAVIPKSSGDPSILWGVPHLQILVQLSQYLRIIPHARYIFEIKTIHTRVCALTSSLPFEPPTASKKGLSSEKEIEKTAP